MTTDPDQIRDQVAALLSDLPDLGPECVADIDLDDVAQRLEAAHNVLVQALESVEKD